MKKYILLLSTLVASGLTQASQAETEKKRNDDLNRFFVTGRCPYGDLSGQDLRPAFENWKYAETKPEIYLDGANLDDANFSSVDLSGAHMVDASIHDTNFENANLENANLNAPSTRLRHHGDQNFQNANLKNTSFINRWLGNANFKNSKAQGADFRKAFLGFADFTRANLSGAKFNNANLIKANFKKANLNNAYFKQNYGRDNSGTSFTGSNFLRATFAQPYYQGIFDNDILTKNPILSKSPFGQYVMRGAVRMVLGYQALKEKVSTAASKLQSKFRTENLD